VLTSSGPGNNTLTLLADLFARMVNKELGTLISIHFQIDLLTMFYIFAFDKNAIRRTVAEWRQNT
jgi:hypothetical protein